MKDTLPAPLPKSRSAVAEKEALISGADGSFEFMVLPGHYYNLVSLSDAYRFSLFVDSIFVGNSPVDVGVLVPQEPESVVVYVEETGFVPGNLIIPGTAIAVPLDRSGTSRVAVPVGAASPVFVDSTGEDAGIPVSNHSYHKITIPKIPGGPDTASVNELVTFTASGSESNQDHDIEYRFAWYIFPFDLSSPEAITSWNSDTVASFSWSTPQEIKVRAQARSAQDTSAFSQWSYYLRCDIIP